MSSGVSHTPALRYRRHFATAGILLWPALCYGRDFAMDSGLRRAVGGSGDNQ